MWLLVAIATTQAGCLVTSRTTVAAPPSGPRMTPNKKTVAAYMDGFRKTDRAQILSCLTDDVEWIIPGAFHVRGKAEFAKHIVDEGFVGHPLITVSLLTEED